VTLASVDLPQAWSAEEAMDARAFTRQTLTLASIGFALREAIGLRSVKRGTTSIGIPSDASDGLKCGLGAYWIAFIEQQTCALAATDASVEGEFDHWCLKLRDTWQDHVRRTRAAASVEYATDTSVGPEIRPMRFPMALFGCGAINRSGGQPWLVLSTLGT
jgi:hypothetical protein